MTDEEFTQAAIPLVRTWQKWRTVVEAVKWDGSSLAAEAINSVLGLDPLTIVAGKRIKVSTPAGEKIAEVGDYIVRDADDVFYPCAAETFERLYELHDDE